MPKSPQPVAEAESLVGVASTDLFSIGDKVRFVKARAVGASIEFKTMEGKITDFSKPKGLRALIKYHGGNYVWKKLTDIHRLDQPSPLNGIIGMENAEAQAAPTTTNPSTTP